MERDGGEAVRDNMRWPFRHCFLGRPPSIKFWGVSMTDRCPKCRSEMKSSVCEPCEQRQKILEVNHLSGVASSIAMMAMLWAWTPISAQVYKVEVDHGDKRGEGTCVSIGNDEQNGYLLTAAHVVGDAKTVMVRDRVSTHRAKVIAKEYANGNDIAVLAIPGMHSKSNYYLSDEIDASDGSVLVGCRLGGPVLARAVKHEERNRYHCSQDVCVGDSGGAIVTKQGYLVGIVNSTNAPTCGDTVWATTNLAHWVRTNCPQGYCPPPRYRVTPIAPARPRVVIDPPQYRVEPLPQPTPIPTPTPAPTVDYERLADVIVARHGSKLKGDKGDRGERGYTGPVGPQGENGAKGEAGTGPSGNELRAAVAAYLQANPLPSPSLSTLELQTAITTYLKAHPEWARVNVVILDSGSEVARHNNLVDGSTVEIDIQRFTTQSQE